MAEVEAEEGGDIQKSKVELIEPQVLEKDADAEQDDAEIEDDENSKEDDSKLKRARENDSEGGAEDDASKRARILDGQRYEISKVLHVRSLPPGVTDDDLVALVTPHGGKIESLVMLSNNQAFLQLDSIETASRILVHYNDPETPAVIQGTTVHIQTAKHSELASGRKPGETIKPSTGNSETILMVVISDVHYPINVDVLEQVFAPFGQLSKMVIFVKGGKTMALVQYVDPGSAHAALNKLDSQNIYAGCCRMKVSYSNSRKDLNVSRQTSMSKDFLAPAAPEAQRMEPQGGALLPVPASAPRGGMPLAQTPPQAAYPYQPAYGGYPPVVPRYAGQPMHHAPPPAYGGAPQGGAANGTVVIVSHLDAEQVNPDYLFRLFGVYGDVLRVKIMFKKRDTALAQFTDGAGAARVVQYLNGFPLWGQPMRINISTHDVVQMPSEPTPFATEYGYGHVMHRFKKGASSKNLQYITEPNTMLHLSSIPLGSDEDEVRSWLSPYGAVLSFKFLKDSTYRQGLATMQSVQQATDAVVGLHNKLVGDKTYLKINYSVAGSSTSREDRLRQQQGGGYQRRAAPAPYQQHHQQPQYAPRTAQYPGYQQQGYAAQYSPPEHGHTQQRGYQQQQQQQQQHGRAAPAAPPTQHYSQAQQQAYSKYYANQAKK